MSDDLPPIPIAYDEEYTSIDLEHGVVVVVHPDGSERRVLIAFHPNGHALISAEQIGQQYPRSLFLVGGEIHTIGAHHTRRWSTYFLDMIADACNCPEIMRSLFHASADAFYADGNASSTTRVTGT